MKVDSFLDHIAYTFEEQETVYQLGLRYIKKLPIREIIPFVKVVHDGCDRVMYEKEQLHNLCEIALALTNSELAIALKQFCENMFAIEDTDYIAMTAIDVKYERLLYDTKQKAIRMIVLPVQSPCDFHDGESWGNAFRRMLLMLLHTIFKESPEKYQEAYYAIMDETKNEKDVLAYMREYSFGVQKVEEKVAVEKSKETKQEETAVRKLCLEHTGVLGSLIFVVTKPEYILGKASSSVDGVIPSTDMISRRHCAIYQAQDRYAVEDLGSTNGTKINGYRIDPGQRFYLNHGDVLSLADVDFNVVIS